MSTSERVVIGDYEYTYSPNTNAPDHGAWFFCNLCSALIYDPNAHSHWHEQLRQDRPE